MRASIQMVVHRHFCQNQRLESNSWNCFEEMSDKQGDGILEQSKILM